MTGQGSRQDRREAFQPSIGPADLLSEDASLYVNQAAKFQREAAGSPELNGAAARGRVKVDD